MEQVNKKLEFIQEFNTKINESKSFFGIEIPFNDNSTLIVRVIPD